jgi:hypothetical protein
MSQITGIYLELSKKGPAAPNEVTRNCKYAGEW